MTELVIAENTIGPILAERGDRITVATDATVVAPDSRAINTRSSDDSHVQVTVHGRVLTDIGTAAELFGVILWGTDVAGVSNNRVLVSETGVVRSDWGIGLFGGTGNQVVNDGHVHGATTAVFTDGVGTQVVNTGRLTGSFGLYGQGEGEHLLNAGQIKADSGLVTYLSVDALCENTGHIRATSHAGMVAASATGAVLRNQGVVRAETTGFRVDDSSDTRIENSGIVSAHHGAEFSSETQLMNDGVIRGDSCGLLLTTLNWRPLDVAEVVNTGRIAGGDHGIRSIGMTLDLENSGVVIGGIHLSEAVVNHDRVANAGEVIGSVNLGLGDDTYVGTGGRVSGVVQGGEGDDRLVGGEASDVLRGGADDDVLIGAGGADQLRGQGGSDLLRGGAGADDLSGGSGDDILNGGDGDDRLDGGRGDDLLRGQAGADVFVFGAASGTDRIAGFEQGIDRIEISDHVGGFDGLTLTLAGGAVVAEHDGGVIHVQGVAALTEADFVFL